MPRWLIWTLLTLLSWGIWAVLIKLIDGKLWEAHSQAISTLGIVPILVVLALTKEGTQVGNRRHGIALAFGSGVLSCLGNIACYQAISHAKAATVVPLTALSPLVTVLLAIPLLKERVNWIQWVGIGVAVTAVFLFSVEPDAAVVSAANSPWLLLALAAVVLWGLTGLMQKMSTNYTSARTSAISFLAAFVPFAAAILISNPLPPGISTRIWLLAIALGFTLALGNLTILLAFASGGNASIITPLAGLYSVVSIPIAILWFGERITGREAVGIALALTAVVLLSHLSQPDAEPAPDPKDVQI
jgi:drug/metabolite transporter (DMT)-like permease